MDIKKYIASGILEEYALGLLAPAEAQDVIAMLNKYPELQTELQLIEYALEDFAHSQKVPVSPEFFSQLTERLAGVEPDPAPPKPPSGGTSGNSMLSWIIGIGLILSLAALAWCFQQSQQTTAQLEATSDAYLALQQDCNTVQEEKQALEDIISILRLPGNSVIPMAGTDNSPNAVASIIWNEALGKSYLNIIDLPAPAADKQYQLWAIVDGTPVDMGVFDLNIDTTGLQEVPFIDRPQAFAVTLEPLGGNPTPTLDQMVLLGAVAG